MLSQSLAWLLKSEISNLKFVIRAQRRGGLAITENRNPAKRLKSQIRNPINCHIAKAAITEH